MVANNIIDVRSHSNPGRAPLEIVGVKATTLEIPYPEEFRAAWHPHIVETLRPATIVQITTDDGIVGIGGSGTRDGQLIRQHIAP